MNSSQQSTLTPTSLDALTSAGVVDVTDAGLTFSVRAEWIVQGEDRLSYATIIRLAECCRELHWRVDTQQDGNTNVDSICSRLNCVFRRPLIIGMTFVASYQIRLVRGKSYVFLVRFTDVSSGRIHAEVSMECVFYDSLNRCAVSIPEPVKRRLAKSLRPTTKATCRVLHTL